MLIFFALNLIVFSKNFIFDRQKHFEACLGKGRRPRGISKLVSMSTFDFFMQSAGDVLPSSRVIVESLLVEYPM